MARLASNNTFSINSPSGDASMHVDSDGNVVVNSLVLIDSVDGSKWKLKITDGELSTEPLDIISKRDWNISKILK
jgi:hypothetical protein